MGDPGVSDSMKACGAAREAGMTDAPECGAPSVGGCPSEGTLGGGLSDSPVADSPEAHSPKTDLDSPNAEADAPGGREVVFDGIVVSYRADAVLGSGGPGDIYKGTISGRQCAVKRTRPKDDEALERVAEVLAEARGFTHKHVIDTLAFGLLDGYVWQVMPLATGSIMQLCGRVPVREACLYAAMVASGVTFLHEGGWVHCDLKPSNILLVGDTPKVCDIDGIVRRGTVSEFTQFTWCYAAPEVARNVMGDSLPADCPRDVWALGITCYEILQRRLPPPLSEDKLEVVSQFERGAMNLARFQHRFPDLTEADRVSMTFFWLLAAGYIVPQMGVDELSKPIKRVLDRCFRRTPGDRCTAAKVRDGFAAVASSMKEQ